MDYVNVNSLNHNEWAVIDMDSGTVLGTNVVLVRVPDENATPGAWEDILSSDSEAWNYGSHNGIPLYRLQEA